MPQSNSPQNTRSPREPFVESASATTSPDNANSGNTAIIIFIVVALLLIGLTLACTSTISFVVNNLVERYEEENSPTNGDTRDDFEELLERYIGDTESSPDQQQNESSLPNRISRSKALGLTLTLYDDNLSSEVTASDYSGASRDASEWVHELVSTDAEYADKVVSELRTAARDNTNAAASLEKAARLCDEASQKISTIEAPKKLEGTDEAVQEVQKRWNATKAEIELINTDSDIRTKKLQDADDEVASSLEDAGDALLDVLDESVSQN